MKPGAPGLGHSETGRLGTVSAPYTNLQSLPDPNKNTNGNFLEHDKLIQKEKSARAARMILRKRRKETGMGPTKP